MGSWGYGMMDSDIACDAIYRAKDVIKNIGKNPVDFTDEELDYLFDHFTHNKSILGVCEWLLDKKDFPVDRLKWVDKYVECELKDHVIKSWKEPDKRVKALEEFRQRFGSDLISHAWRKFMKEKTDGTSESQ